MSRDTKIKLSWFTGISLSIGLILVVSLMGSSTPPTREITLVAKNMGFYLAGETKVNPTLVFHQGERVLVNFINHDKGVIHDLLFPQFEISTGKVRYKKSAQLTLQFNDQGQFE